ncbi:hypothetical protein LSH36_348g01006 [Paralvinella palmiformis]|uniref:COX assembly mitochondrial protein n=1 Tax=Paralvinella palmiformis TaxID=53620 RepID=A0AAD9JGQ4_9ANNE|nr:hypothetical protein LSH36_348g01006 [Paralvinella palmiformis]
MIRSALGTNRPGSTTLKNQAVVIRKPVHEVWEKCVVDVLLVKVVSREKLFAFVFKFINILKICTMHPDLSPHLHSTECNKLIKLLHECHREYPVGKYFGKCSSVDLLVGKCLKKERNDNRMKNKEKKKKTIPKF